MNRSSISINGFPIFGAIGEDIDDTHMSVMDAFELYDKYNPGHGYSPPPSSYQIKIWDKYKEKYGYTHDPFGNQAKWTQNYNGRIVEFTPIGYFVSLRKI